VAIQLPTYFWGASVIVLHDNALTYKRFYGNCYLIHKIKGRIMGEFYKAVDYSKVEELAAAGLTQVQIGQSLGISKRTITRRLQDDEEFADAYERGRAGLCQEVASLLLGYARNGSIDACKYLGDRLCGWRKEIRQEVEVKAAPSINLVFPKSLEEMEKAEP
jgi:hypothetical protein